MYHNMSFLNLPAGLKRCSDFFFFFVVFQTFAVLVNCYFLITTSIVEIVPVNINCCLPIHVFLLFVFGGSVIFIFGVGCILEEAVVDD